MTKILDGKEDAETAPINDTAWTDIFSRSKTDPNLRKHYIDWYLEWQTSSVTYGFALRAIIIEPDANIVVLGRQDLITFDVNMYFSWRGQDTFTPTQTGEHFFKIQARVEDVSVDLLCRRRRVVVEQE
jgi:hypothetical protein